jgi:Ca-activated chloride channel family protein
MSAKIHIERMMHRSSIAVGGDTAASYALLKLIPAGEGTKSLGLNLALVLDVSGSMYEEDGTGLSRLKRIQSAALSAIQKLKPEDSLAIVAFGHDAKVMLESTPLSDKEKIEQTINMAEQWDVDPGGTTMDQGIALGMQEIEKRLGQNCLSQMLVLTDGETSGETQCRQLAKQAGEKKIHFSMMGVGTEWNANLIKDLAKLANGKWHYIDVSQAEETERIFIEEFEALAATAFNNVELHLWPSKDVRVKRARQVVPDIRELTQTEPEERHYVAAIGTLEKDKPTKYILDLSLPKRPDGTYVICQLEVSYDVGRGRESTGKVPLQMQYTAAAHGFINAEVARHIDEIQINEQNKILQEAIATGDKDEVKRAAEAIEKKAEVMGKRAAKKTMLAKQVLNELNVGGRVSKKTMLAMDAAAMEGEE